MEKQLYATLKVDMEHISAQLAKVIAAAQQLESAVNDLQSTLSNDAVKVTLSEKKEKAISQAHGNSETPYFKNAQPCKVSLPQDIEQKLRLWLANQDKLLKLQARGCKNFNIKGTLYGWEVIDEEEPLKES